MLYLGLLAVLSVVFNYPIWLMLSARPEHPRFVAPAVLFDVPNTTYSGGLI